MPRFVRIRGERIWLADVDVGSAYQPQIVWGGVPVVQEGSLVPVAPPGAWLPATKDRPRPYKIRRCRYRGEVSGGMLCSLAELGWDPSATEHVALLDGSAGLCPGQSLDNHHGNWQAIVMPVSDSRVEMARPLPGHAGMFVR